MNEAAVARMKMYYSNFHWGNYQLAWKYRMQYGNAGNSIPRYLLLPLYRIIFIAV